MSRPARDQCGTRAAYIRGCRCDACRDASRRYHRERTIGRPPDPLPPIQDWPDSRWARHGACVGLHPDLFHPARGEPAHHAKAICATCPVVDECLAWAVQTGQQHGIWGGKSQRERRRIRLQQTPRVTTLANAS